MPVGFSLLDGPGATRTIAGRVGLLLPKLQVLQRDASDNDPNIFAYFRYSNQNNRDSDTDSEVTQFHVSNMRLLLKPRGRIEQAFRQETNIKAQFSRSLI